MSTSIAQKLAAQLSVFALVLGLVIAGPGQVEPAAADAGGRITVDSSSRTSITLTAHWPDPWRHRITGQAGTTSSSRIDIDGFYVPRNTTIQIKTWGYSQCGHYGSCFVDWQGAGNARWVKIRDWNHFTIRVK